VTKTQQTFILEPAVHFENHDASHRINCAFDVHHPSPEHPARIYRDLRVVRAGLAFFWAGGGVADGMASRRDRLEGLLGQAVLCGLEDLAFFVADVRVEELAEALEARAGRGHGLAQIAQSRVLCTDSLSQSGLANCLQRREEVLLLDLEVRLEPAGEGLADLLPCLSWGQLGIGLRRALAASGEHEAGMVIVRQLAQAR